ncbi:HD domain-containing protein [Blastococcus sp. SYSU DS0973]
MLNLQQRGLHDAAIGSPLVEAARGLASQLLADLDGRWRHTCGVARRAADAAAAVPRADRPLLVAAAWLHDIGYAPTLHASGFHPLDGAWHLQALGWPEPVAALVAHHSAARFVAAVHGLDDPMRAFSALHYGHGPVADALTYADQTTGPDGQIVTVEERLAEMLRRHGPDSPNGRVHAQRAPVVRGAVRRVEERAALAELAREVLGPQQSE